jgi:hypothetical protein
LKKVGLGLSVSPVSNNGFKFWLSLLTNIEGRSEQLT